MQTTAQVLETQNSEAEGDMFGDFSEPTLAPTTSQVPAQDTQNVSDTTQEIERANTLSKYDLFSDPVQDSFQKQQPNQP
jgi:hypothetical protein